MDDLIALCEGLRAALPGVLAPGEMAPADAALDEAIERVPVAPPAGRRRAQEEPRSSSSIYKGG